jgi:hypothetical protein
MTGVTMMCQWERSERRTASWERFQSMSPIAARHFRRLRGDRSGSRPLQRGGIHRSKQHLILQECCDAEVDLV